MDRRTFLHDLSRHAFLCAGIPNAWRVRHRPWFQDDPFTLGVASGDPTPDRCVIWTRLAPRPLEPESGVTSGRTVVQWEVAHDEGFARIARSGRHTAAPELGYSVHVDVDGLDPDRWYYYRFMTGDAVSPVGMLRTTPPVGQASRLDFAFASCQHWEDGYFTAYRHLATEDRLDLVAHLGDYIYEYASNERVRAHHGSEILTLADYRLRYAQYKTDPLLQGAHARCPWLVTWDDHEVDNNYAGLAGENRVESVEQMRNRRAAGYQAWWENQPVRVPRAQSWADLTIRRSTRWGALARIWVLDTRQYRSDQACGDGTRAVPCEDWGDPRRTLLGEEQERWLVNGLGASSARWQVLAQQVMMGAFDREPGPEVRTHMDQWGGYPVARDRLLRSIAERAPNRTVVLTGDIHSSWVHELHAGFDRPDRPVVAAEFVGTSISSGGDGSEETMDDDQVRENPHFKWHNRRRGYVYCSVDPDAWSTAYRVVPFVSREGAGVATASQWRIDRGRAGVQRVG